MWKKIRNWREKKEAFLLKLFINAFFFSKSLIFIIIIFNVIYEFIWIFTHYIFYLKKFKMYGKFDLFYYLFYIRIKE